MKIQKKSVETRSNKLRKVMEMYQNIQSHQKLPKRAFPVDESLTAVCQAFVNHSQPT